jgi:hypothetical protein
MPLLLLLALTVAAPPSNSAPPPPETNPAPERHVQSQPSDPKPAGTYLAEAPASHATVTIRIVTDQAPAQGSAQAPTYGTPQAGAVPISATPQTGWIGSYATTTAAVAQQPGPVGQWLGSVGTRLSRCGWTKLRVPPPPPPPTATVAYQVVQSQSVTPAPIASYQTAAVPTPPAAPLGFPPAARKSWFSSP